MPTYDILENGAVGDGQTLDTRAIQAAIDQAAANGGGRVVIPAGLSFLTGTIALKSHVELHLEHGARLVASDDIEQYTAHAFPTAQKGHALLVADGATDVALTGGGTIDGQGKKFMNELGRYHYKGKRQRPHLIRFSHCTNVTMRDIVVEDSANWAVHLSCCEDVLIHGIRILNDLALPNCDGIDPDHCRNVRISDCFIQAGDDCIVIKNRREEPDGGPSEDIVVTNCVLCSTSTAIKIGTESEDDFRNILVSNCVIRSSNRGLSIQLRDKGNVENVLFTDCTVETRYFSPGWWGRAEPIYVTAIHRAPGTVLGEVRNVRFRNILCKSENGVFIAGSEDSPVRDLVLENVQVEISKWSKWPGGQQDRRPCMEDRSDFSIDHTKDKGLSEHATSGVFAENARDLTLRNVEVRWGENPQEYWSHALEAHCVEGLTLENFTGQGARDGVDAQKIDDTPVWP